MNIYLHSICYYIYGHELRGVVTQWTPKAINYKNMYMAWSVYIGPPRGGGQGIFPWGSKLFLRKKAHEASKLTLFLSLSIASSGLNE